MNRIAEHINFLLFENDFVIIPSLGGFVINKDQSYYDANKETLIGPHYWIGFNQSLTHNDGLLIQLYATSQNISTAEADKLVKEDVALLKAQLYSSCVVELFNWGKLYINKENTVCFKASEMGGSFSRPNYFGLQDLHIKTLDEIIDNKPTEENAEITENIRTTPIRTILKLTAASAAAALLLFTISIPISETKVEKEQTAGFFTSKNISAEQSTNITEKPLVQPKENLLKEKTTDKNTMSATPNSQNQNQDNYYLIVGTFQTTTIASKELETFKHIGFTKSGILESYKVKRVFIEGFASLTEANSKLSTFIKDNPKYKDAWVYTRKDKDKLIITK